MLDELCVLRGFTPADLAADRAITSPVELDLCNDLCSHHLARHHHHMSALLSVRLFSGRSGFIDQLVGSSIVVNNTDPDSFAAMRNALMSKLDRYRSLHHAGFVIIIVDFGLSFCWIKTRARLPELAFNLFNRPVSV